MGKTLTAADVLSKARTLITKREAWHPTARAVSRKGSLVDPRGKAAVAWSARGAVERSARDNGLAETQAIKALRVAMGDSIEEFCLVHGHKKTLAAIDAAELITRMLCV